MLKLYCQKCGALNTYVSEKPNFCQKCGQSFGAATETAAPNQAATNKIVKAPQQPQPQPEPEKVEEGFANNLSQLEVDIVQYKSSTDTVGSLANTSDGSANFLENMSTAEEYTLEDFKREAGFRDLTDKCTN